MTVLIAIAGPLAGAAAVTAAERLGAGQSWHSGQNPGAASLIAGALAGSAIAAAALIAAPTDTALMTAGLGWLLFALAMIDLRTRTLPDGLNFGVFLLGAAMVVLTRPDAWMYHVAGVAAGFSTLWIVETLYLRLRGTDGLGRGDAKLLGALGMWVTWTGIAPVLLIASLTGLAAVLVSAAFRRQTVTSTTAIAFGPWIALGGWLVWLASPLTGPLFFG